MDYMSIFSLKSSPSEANVYGYWIYVHEKAIVTETVWSLICHLTMQGQCPHHVETSQVISFAS